MFKIPKHTFQDPAELAKFSLTWKVALMFLVVVGLSTIISFLEADPFFPHYLFVWTVVTLGLIYLFYSKNYKVVSIGISIGATLAIISSIYFVRDVSHVIEILWMIVIVLFCFFTLGSLWGSIFIIVEIIIYVVYFNTLFYKDMGSLNNITTSIHWIMSIEFSFALFLIGYITHQFRVVNSHAIKMKDEAYEAIIREKEVINRQNAEKTVLLQEIHHRVKNNLQVIVSLLRTQASELKSEEAKRNFDEAISRVMTMSLIHQKMYESKDLNNLNIEDYFQTLINEIILSSGKKDELKLALRVEAVGLDLEIIVPLALIINELVSNSLKHAFEEQKGAISIAIAPKNDGFLTLTFQDNGKWKEPSGNSFGLQLIDVFTEQLDGSFKREISESGTKYNFTLRSKKMDMVKLNNSEL